MGNTNSIENFGPVPRLKFKHLNWHLNLRIDQFFGKGNEIQFFGPFFSIKYQTLGSNFNIKYLVPRMKIFQRKKKQKMFRF